LTGVHYPINRCQKFRSNPKDFLPSIFDDKMVLVWLTLSKFQNIRKA
jgi:hypothetical protein